MDSSQKIISLQDTARLSVKMLFPDNIQKCYHTLFKIVNLKKHWKPYFSKIPSSLFEQEKKNLGVNFSRQFEPNFGTKNPYSRLCPRKNSISAIFLFLKIKK